MTLKMKEEIESFKANNGNANFTTKELVMYSIQRIDNMDEKFDAKLNAGTGKIAENRANIKGQGRAIKTQRKWMVYLFSGAFGFCLFVLGVVLNLHGVLS